jgi:hypothetical protein
MAIRILNMKKLLQVGKVTIRVAKYSKSCKKSFYATHDMVFCLRAEGGQCLLVVLVLQLQE